MILLVVTASSARSAVPTSPSKILSVVTASAASLGLVTLPSASSVVPTEPGVIPVISDNLAKVPSPSGRVKFTSAVLAPFKMNFAL